MNIEEAFESIGCQSEDWMCACQSFSLHIPHHSVYCRPKSVNGEGDNGIGNHVRALGEAHSKRAEHVRKTEREHSVRCRKFLTQTTDDGRIITLDIS